MGRKSFSVKQIVNPQCSQVGEERDRDERDDVEAAEEDEQDPAEELIFHARRIAHVQVVPLDILWSVEHNASAEN